MAAGESSKRKSLMKEIRLILERELVNGRMTTNKIQ